MAEASVETPARPQTTCPTCSAPAERGQLVCLECGSRIALAYRRPPSWKIGVAISIVLLVLVCAGAVLAYRAIDGDAEREVAAAPARVSDRAAGTDDAPDEAAETPAAESDDGAAPSNADDDSEAQGGAGEEPAGEPGSLLDSDGEAESGGLQASGALHTWPRDLEGFTVVLLSNEDRSSATSFAESAAAARSEKIGVIRSDDFESLPTGFFLVFAGRYPDRRSATAASRRLGRSFQGAFPQVVKR